MSCQRKNRLPITVQVAQRVYNWARVMSSGIAIHEMATESIITIDTGQDGISWNS